MPPGLFSYIDPSPPAAPEGILTGKTVAIQPNMCVRGWPTEAGSVALERFVATEDATAVARLRDAGATIVGSARMAELGFGLTGDATAQAAAEAGCDAALITDTMGEARLAALKVGLLGFKPSYGIVSRFGLIGLVPSMECYGIAACAPGQVAAALASIAGADERDVSMLQSPLPDFTDIDAAPDKPVVAGAIRECAEALAPAEAEAFSAALSMLEAADVRVEEVSMPEFDLFRTVHNVIGAAEASSSAGKYDSVRYGHRSEKAENWNEMYLESRAESFGMLVKSYLFQGAYFQFRDYAAFENACRIRRQLVNGTTALFEKVDVLVCPVRRRGPDAAAAATLEEVYGAFALALAANVTGQPSLSMPGLMGSGGDDLGLQLMAPHLADARLLSLAARLARN